MNYSSLHPVSFTSFVLVEPIEQKVNLPVSTQANKLNSTVGEPERAMSEEDQKFEALNHNYLTPDEDGDM